MEKIEIMKVIIAAICDEQCLSIVTEDNFIRLFDRKGNIVAELYNLKHYSVTSFIKEFGEKLSTNLI